MTMSANNSGSGALHSQCPPPNAVRRRGGTYSSFLKFGLAAVLVLLLALCMAMPESRFVRRNL